MAWDPTRFSILGHVCTDICNLAAEHARPTGQQKALMIGNIKVAWNKLSNKRKNALLMGAEKTSVEVALKFTAEVSRLVFRY
jgi:hypothetical protein